jgi:hypothetical protein
VLQQRGVAGHTLPLAVQKNPGIGEAAMAVKRFVLVDAFGEQG